MIVLLSTESWSIIIGMASIVIAILIYFLQKQIRYPGQLKFALVETWKVMSAQWLLEKISVDVADAPETSFVHPYSKLEKIYTSTARTYSKHWREIKEIFFKLTWEDFDNLYHSGRCNSFREFYDSIFL